MSHWDYIYWANTRARTRFFKDERDWQTDYTTTVLIAADSFANVALAISEDKESE